jgi:drug/metabolite transporter (DMT)-like permease
VIAILMAAGSAAFYGAADFLGGLSASRWTAVRATAVSQAAGIPILLIGAAIVDAPAVTSADLAWGFAGGLSGVVGIASYYHALAIGPMSVTAPMAAVTSALLPLGVGLASGERPGVVPLGGALLGVVAVAFLSVAPHPDARRGGLGAVRWAVLGGLGIGGFYAFLGQASPDAGLWPLLPERILATIVLTPIAFRPRFRGREAEGRYRLGLAAGVADMGANMLFLLAVHRDLLSLVGVISAMYPASTMALARFVLHERLARLQVVGAALALISLAMIALR